LEVLPYEFQKSAHQTVSNSICSNHLVETNGMMIAHCDWAGQTNENPPEATRILQVLHGGCNVYRPENGYQGTRNSPNCDAAFHAVASLCLAPQSSHQLAQAAILQAILRN
jgi:hypothetical protein